MAELKAFILRSQVLVLYRSFVRELRHVPQPNRGKVEVHRG